MSKLKELKPSQVLRRARALVAKGWTRRAFDRTRRGKVCYCADGALGVAAHGYMALQRKAGVYLEIAANTSNIWGWNDEQKSKAPVLRAFDEAAKRAKADGQ